MNTTAKMKTTSKIKMTASLSCYLLVVIYQVLPVTCYLSLVSCQLLPATCYLLLATCYLLPVTCYILLIIRWYLESDSLHLIISYLKPLISCKRIASFCSCSATRSCLFWNLIYLFWANFLTEIFLNQTLV